MTDRRVVFDCNVFAQSLLSPNGPAGALSCCCKVAALNCSSPNSFSTRLANYISSCRLAPASPRRTRKTWRSLSDHLQRFFILLQRSTFIIHPIDPDDSAYVNLAFAANAELIVSRDKHLLGLNDETKPWSQAFRDRFPDMRVLTPDKFAGEYRNVDEVERG